MSDSEFASLVYAVRLDKWMTVSMSALAIFEYITTFEQEVSSVWKRKRSGASLLLFAVRYTMLASAISSVSLLAALNPKGCFGGSITVAVWDLLGAILTAAFSALRVYALCGGSVKLSATVFLLQLCPVAVNTYSYVEATYITDPPFGCIEADGFDLRTQNLLALASRIPLTIGDACVIIVTWIKSFQQLRMQRSLGVHLPLSTLLFRDGTVYFLILLILNVLEISPLTSVDGGLIIGGLNSILPLILINQFMLNLRQLSDSEAHSAGHIRTISTPMFRMSVDIAGNMGQSLEHNWETRDIDELEVEEAVLEEEVVDFQPAEVRRNVQERGLDIAEVPRDGEEAVPSESQLV